MKVMIVEDERLFRDMLEGTLTSRGIDVVTASDERDALEVVDRQAPDIAILDIRLPPTLSDEGLKIAETLRGRYPDIGLVVLSMFGEIPYARRLLSMQGGTRSLAYLLKNRVAGIDDLVADLHRVAAGNVVIDPQLVEKLMKRPVTNDRLERLTARQRQILALVAQGYSDLGIAQKLNVKVSNVEKHLAEIRQTLGLPSGDDPHRANYNVRVLATLAFLAGTRSGPDQAG
jgi:DNA-binding NarL/FixJ family response regulator